MAYHFLERSPCRYQLQKRYDDDKTVRHNGAENQATRFPVRLPRPGGGQEAFADVKNYFAGWKGKSLEGAPPGAALGDL